MRAPPNAARHCLQRTRMHVPAAACRCHPLSRAPCPASNPPRSCNYDVSGSQPKRAEADDGQVAQVSCPCQKVAEIFLATWTTGNTDCASNYIRTE